MTQISVRREIKNRWERRTPVTPTTMRELENAGVHLTVERSPIRVYTDSDFEAAGATLVDTTNDANIVVGIKEPQLAAICEGQAHLCFGHVIKGQPHNMPMLRAFLERGATLIDYEPMINEKGDRIASVFSRFAGFSGTIETLGVAAKKLTLQGKSTTLSSLKQPWQYERIAVAENALRALAPFREALRILIVGRGNVGNGCIRVCKALQLPELTPAELESTSVPAGPWYCVVDAPEITRARDGRAFDFPTYVEMGTQLFDSTFDRLLGKFDVLLQGAYWDDRYPRQLPLELIRGRKDELPFIIGDISCDIDGTLECTTKATSIDEPAFTFNTRMMKAEAGITENGPTVMSIDNLPCELPADASDEFASLLVPSIRSLAKANFQAESANLAGLSLELERGTIVYRGSLVPRYKYLEQYL